MSIKEQLAQHVTSVKTAVVAGGATTGTGLSTWFDVIPDDIGKFASLIGICLTGVLIVFHVRKGLLDIKKSQLEIEILKKDAARSLIHIDAADEEDRVDTGERRIIEKKKNKKR